MAIVGLEEYGESSAYALAALSPKKQDSFIERLGFHDVQRMVIIAAKVAEIETGEDCHVEVDCQGYPFTEEDRLEVLFGELVKKALGTLGLD